MQFGVLAQVLFWHSCCFGEGQVCFCEIDGRVLEGMKSGNSCGGAVLGCCSGSCLRCSSGSAVRVAGVKSLARVSLSGVYDAGVIVFIIINPQKRRPSLGMVVEWSHVVVAGTNRLSFGPPGFQ